MDEHGNDYLLVADQMLWFGKLLGNSLINPNQIRNFGIELNDNPYSDGDFGITFESTFIPFDATGTIVYFESRVPTEWEEKHLPVILLTAEVWDCHIPGRRSEDLA